MTARAAAAFLACALLGGGSALAAEEADLRERLTEREDRLRPPEPFTVEVGGHPLTLGGEADVELSRVGRRDPARGAEEPNRLLLETQLELEAFYALGRPLSFFLQARAVGEKDLYGEARDAVSTAYVERGETWVHLEDIAGSRVDLDFGRLDFEDERRWWWDDELDAVRVAYETDDLEIALALQRELGPRRSDEDVDPRDEGVLRLIGEAGWDYARSHSAELFLLAQDDRSRREAVGETAHADREDDADARLLWLGARGYGVFDPEDAGLLGYWLDAALVQGRERAVFYEALSPTRSAVERTRRRGVRGWALDLGVNYTLPCALEPRLLAGWAYGSGDPHPESGGDRSFRQTGLHANEAGFGGVERFAHYGEALDPELSNLHVLTAGLGFSLLEASSLDLVYHRYRLDEPASALRDARLEADLDGRSRALGDGFDAVLALEEWERLQLRIVGAAFRAGPAFGAARGRWSSFFAVTLTAAF